MDDPIQMPIVIYDDKCSLCSMFAKMVSFFGCGRISLIGHYSKDGLRMRSRLGDHATEMFWLLEDTVAFGGRAALLRIILAEQFLEKSPLQNMEAFRVQTVLHARGQRLYFLDPQA